MCTHASVCSVAGGVLFFGVCMYMYILRTDPTKKSDWDADVVADTEQRLANGPIYIVSVSMHIYNIKCVKYAYILLHVCMLRVM